MINGLHIDDKDTVVTLAAAASPGDTVVYVEDGIEKTVEVLSEIPIYHKMAVKAVPKGGKVIKYGELIAIAAEDIVPGQHVHTHNTEEPERG